MGRLTLVLGGARSGKSDYARSLACQRGQRVVFIATAQALDLEMQVRIEKHKKNRPSHWQTLEFPYQIANNLRKAPLEAEVVLLDCLSLLVNNILLKEVASEDIPEEGQATQALQDEISALLILIKEGSPEWIVVSNEVGMGLVPPYPLGRIYRDLLGMVNKQMAAAADEVYFLVSGIALPLHLLGTFHQ